MSGKLSSFVQKLLEHFHQYLFCPSFQESVIRNDESVDVSFELFVHVDERGRSRNSLLDGEAKPMSLRKIFFVLFTCSDPKYWS